LSDPSPAYDFDALEKALRSFTFFALNIGKRKLFGDGPASLRISGSAEQIEAHDPN
jgi:hypothetical protein